MSGDDDDETLIASKDWRSPEVSRPRPAAGAPPPGYPGAARTQPLPIVSPPVAPAALAAPEAVFATPPFVMSFLLVCGVLTALGLIALIYLEM